MARASDLVESMAIFGAVACLAHCIALPLLIALLPALTAVTPLPTTFHIVALTFAIPTTALALWLGYRRHGWLAPLFGGFVGLAQLAIGVLVFREGPLESLDFRAEDKMARPEHAQEGLAQSGLQRTVLRLEIEQVHVHAPIMRTSRRG